MAAKLPIELSNGEITLREPNMVAERTRRPIMTQMGRMGEVAEAAEAATTENARRLAAGEEVSTKLPELELMSELYDYNDLIAVAMIRAWTYKGVKDEAGLWTFDPDADDATIMPITAEALAGLPGGDYDAILKITAPYALELVPSFGVDPDPKVGTGSSSESNGLSTAELQILDTP